MTRSELIERLVEHQTEMTHRDTELAVKLILDDIISELAGGGRIEIRGFGSFSLHYRPARRGRNPKTGEAVDIPHKYMPHFKPGKDLRERVDASQP
jgi:integration host factor subunit beta